MTQEFKVGDKVRILNVDGIQYGGYYWKNGDVLKVVNISVAGDPKVECEPGDKEGLIINRREYHCIELVSQKTMKSQRITDAEIAIKAMQYEIAELKFEVATLKQAQKPSGNLRGEYAIPHKGEEVLRGNFKTPNEKRKAVIAEAKAFVAKYEAVRAGESNRTRKGTKTARSHYYETEFTVSNSKVTAVIYRLDSGRARQGKSSEIGHSKCAPDDVFNADIGKAIALGRALGLDVKRFEQAVKPTEVVIGMEVRTKYYDGCYNDDCPTEVTGFTDEGYPEFNNGSYSTLFEIKEDTDAQY